jgi:hypothetical protein
MSRDQTRTMRPPADRPLPPVRTLRGEIRTPPAPSGAWVAPVRSGIGGAPVVEAEAELVLEDEVAWVADPDSVVEALGYGEDIEPVESLTVAGDVARTEPDEPDPAALAAQLERLADRLRMHGSHALDESRDAANPMEAAVAAVLASLLAKSRR